MGDHKEKGFPLGDSRTTTGESCSMKPLITIKGNEFLPITVSIIDKSGGCTTERNAVYTAERFVSFTFAKATVKNETTCHGRFYYTSIINIGIFDPNWYYRGHLSQCKNRLKSALISVQKARLG